MTELKATYHALLDAQQALESMNVNYFDSKSLNKAWYLLEDVVKHVFQERTSELDRFELRTVVRDLERALDHVSEVGPFEDSANSAAHYEAMAKLEGVLTVLS